MFVMDAFISLRMGRGVIRCEYSLQDREEEGKGGVDAC